MRAPCMHGWLTCNINVALDVGSLAAALCDTAKLQS